MDDFLGIAIVGIIAALIIEGINKLVKPESTLAKGITVVASIVIGGLYFLFKDTIWWQTMLGVLASASTVYAFFLKGRK